MAEFGLESLSSTQVSRAAALLDSELEAWRTRRLGQVRYLVLDARYEKQRDGGVVRDAAVLSAIGIGPDGRRRVLGVSTALSEAEVHWRAFLDSLIARGMRGVEFIVSDDHAGLRAARQAVLPGAIWQRCQFHLAQNAIHHAPNLAIRKRLGTELRRLECQRPGRCRGRVEAPGRRLRQDRPEARGLAGGQRPRGPRRVSAARTSPHAPAHLQPHGARHPAGDQTSHL